MQLPDAALRYLSRGIQAGVDFAAADLATEPSGDSLRYVRTTDIAGPRRLKAEGVYAPRGAVPASAVGEPGDLLMTRAGSLGTSYLVGQERVAVAGYLVRCRLDLSLCEPRFYAYVAQSRPFLEAIDVGATETTIRNFSASKYAALRVPAPAKSTQVRVANFLDAETARIDTLIKKNWRVLHTATERFTAYITDKTTGYQGDRFSQVPIRWLALIRPSGVDKKSRPDDRPVRLCNYTDVYHSEIISNDMDLMDATATDSEWQRLRLLPGDVVITKDSETADDVAIPALVAESLDNVVLGYHNTLIRPDRRRLDSAFLYWTLRSQWSASYFEPRARGITRVGLRAEDISSLPVPLPSLHEQRRIAAELERESKGVSELSAKVQRQIELLRERREALITAAVTGQIDV